MRKRDENLPGELLATARAIVTEAGPDALTIRALATQAGVSSGTVYNYFKDKDELLLELTYQDWQSALATMQEVVSGGGFVGQIARIYDYLRGQMAASAGPLMNSLEAVKPEGRLRMQQMQELLWQDVLRRLEADPAVRPDVWTASFTRKHLATFVVRHLVVLLQRPSRSGIDFFCELLGRILY